MKWFYAVLLSVFSFVGIANTQTAGAAETTCAADGTAGGAPTVVTYGNGGDYQVLQDAIKAIPPETGGVIKILPGTYYDSVWVRDHGSITFRGVRDAQVSKLCPSPRASIILSG